MRAEISQEKRCSVGLGARRRVDQMAGDAAPSLGTAPGCESWKPVTLLAHQHILTPKANLDLLTRCIWWTRSPGQLPKLLLSWLSPPPHQVKKEGGRFN